jgi:hypothetical protein
MYVLGEFIVNVLSFSGMFVSICMPPFAILLTRDSRIQEQAIVAAQAQLTEIAAAAGNGFYGIFFKHSRKLIFIRVGLMITLVIWFRFLVFSASISQPIQNQLRPCSSLNCPA